MHNLKIYFSFIFFAHIMHNILGFIQYYYLLKNTQIRINSLQMLPLV